jgi:tRNA U34 5-methylaminomethyl-2-thiouridine-forming methyltransferase MnmC
MATNPDFKLVLLLTECTTFSVAMRARRSLTGAMAQGTPRLDNASSGFTRKRRAGRISLRAAFLPMKTVYS